VPNFAAISHAVAEIWSFFDFSRWRPPPSSIFKIWEFYGCIGSRWPKYVTEPCFESIGQIIAEIW